MEVGVKVPSPAVAFVGRHNSGKTTLLVQVIKELVDRGCNIGTVKHHGHCGFDIDVPGKDSYRHREAGSVDTVIVAPDRIARITDIVQEPSFDEVLATMPNHDLVIVEGYRESGLPVIEVLRAANERDLPATEEFIATGRVRDRQPVAIVTDMPDAADAAKKHGIDSFDINDVRGVADYLQDRFVRPCLTVVIQAGGESRRMGQSKALVPFLGAPLITRIIARLAPVADEVVITTNESEKLQFLLEEDYGCPVRLVPDIHEQRGALRGIETALDAALHPLVAIVACDMVYASSQLVMAEASLLHKGGYDAVVPYNQNGYEPFHAVYRKETCLTAVRDALARGNARAKDYFDEVNVRKFMREEVLRAVPQGGCFVNANYPEDLKRLEASILAEGDK